MFGNVYLQPLWLSTDLSEVTETGTNVAVLFSTASSRAVQTFLESYGFWQFHFATLIYVRIELENNIASNDLFGDWAFYFFRNSQLSTLLPFKNLHGLISYNLQIPPKNLIFLLLLFLKYYFFKIPSFFVKSFEILLLNEKRCIERSIEWLIDWAVFLRIGLFW